MRSDLLAGQSIVILSLSHCNLSLSLSLSLSRLLETHQAHDSIIFDLATMQSLAVLQTVCRRWKSSLSLIDSQIACISLASHSSHDDSIVISHSPASLLVTPTISQATPAWGSAARFNSADQLLKRHGCGPDRRHVRHCTAWRA